MDDAKMRDELVTFLSDGPTATSLAWAFERLLRHPDKLARLRAEALAGESEEYVDAVVKETLRLCPAVPVVMRLLRESMQLDGYTIPAGTIVAPCVYLMHRRADLYPRPRAFEPERFLDGEGGRAINTYTWIPFGGGVRRCVAVVFAQLEMKRVIQTVLREVELRPAATRSEGAARSSVSFAPDGGATVIATRRRPAPVDVPSAARSVATLGQAAQASWWKRAAERVAHTNSPQRWTRPAACRRASASVARSSLPSSRASSCADHGPRASASSSNVNTARSSSSSARRTSSPLRWSCMGRSHAPFRVTAPGSAYCAGATFISGQQ